MRKPSHRCDVNHLANRSTSLVLVIAYRPQQKSIGSPFSVFLDEFSELVMDYHILKPAPVFMVGDFNLHVNKPTKPEPRAFLNFLTASELQQHVAVPTPKDGNTLDLLIDRVSDLPTFTDWKVIDGITSDHFAVGRTSPAGVCKRVEALQVSHDFKTIFLPYHQKEKLLWHETYTIS